MTMGLSNLDNKGEGNERCIYALLQSKTSKMRVKNHQQALQVIPVGSRTYNRQASHSNELKIC